MDHSVGRLASRADLHLGVGAAAGPKGPGNDIVGAQGLKRPLQSNVKHVKFMLTLNCLNLTPLGPSGVGSTARHSRRLA